MTSISQPSSSTGTEPTASSRRESSQPYAAPSRHGEALIEPGFDTTDELIRRNQQLQGSYGNFFQTLRSRAQSQLIEDAIRYTSAYRDTRWATSRMDAAESRGERPLVLMAGHQPAIFHSGVWFKNFTLGHLGDKHAAVPINLVIDNDVAPGCSIRVPSLDSQTGLATRVTVAYDDGGGGVPYEQTTIRDLETFDRVEASVRSAVAPLVSDPAIGKLWKHARDAISRCGVAGCALAQARHGLEGELGLRTLELPLGVLCRGSAFAEFVLAIVGDMPAFQQCYNDEANRYRRSHGIRSSAHPVPNLAQQGEWLEAPFWIYGNDAPQRRPAWIRLSDGKLQISDQPLNDSSVASEASCLEIDVRHPKLAAEQLANSVHLNFKLRPRALITTMYARLVLSDLFLHGIGGGKYDQLGDRITERFFQITPPEFMVISATVQLPQAVGEPRDFDQEIADCRRKLRDTVFQPERFAAQAAMSVDDLAKKQALLGSIPEEGPDAKWHADISAVNDRLAASLVALRGELQDKLSSLTQQRANRRLLVSREHPFCVFPIDYLMETYRRLLGN